MGTRSLTRVFDDNQELVTIYRQYDGYPSGHGVELAEFLGGMKIVNGIPGNASPPIANGPGDLAAQLIHSLKKGNMVGGIYIEPTGTSGVSEEYEYAIHVEVGKSPIIELFDTYADDANTPIFKGTAKEFINWVTKENES